jgi:hypothetical protein
VRPTSADTHAKFFIFANNVLIMKKILSLKHWQVFILLIIGALCYNLHLEESRALSVGFSILGIMIYSLWPLLVSNELNRLLPKKVVLNFNFFLINTFIWLVVFVGILILSDGRGMTFTGVSAIPMFYVLFAYLYFLAYPVRLLNSIEKGGVAGFSKYIGDLFLVAFLPIGIWFLQPRINKVFNDHEQSTLEMNRLIEL